MRVLSSSLLTSEKYKMFKSLIIAAHYDDEIIGLGTRLPYLGSLYFVHTTDSSPYDLKDAKLHGFNNRLDYHKQRKKEFLNALFTAGIKDYGITHSGIADENAVYYLKYLIDYIDNMIRSIKPDLIFTHPYEGGHPDHDATSFAVHCAAQRNKIKEILEFPSYYSNMGYIKTGSFLPSISPVTEIDLSEEEQQLKKNMLSCFTTQQQTLHYFSTEKELLRVSPGYDYKKPPHEGTLFYENYNWGIKGDVWRRIVNEYA